MDDGHNNTSSHKAKCGPLRAHSAADVYRLMDEDELAELVASIRANGLRDPITVGIIGKDRWIIDGRNREKACAIADVSPEYEEIKFTDEDALRLFVADRNERRNITKSQKAMAYAMLFPEPEKRGRGNKREKDLPTKSFSASLLSQARAVLAYSPQMAAEVRDGSSLAEAFKAADAHNKRAATETALWAELANAPDLAEAVREEKIGLREAVAELKERVAYTEGVKQLATESLARAVRELRSETDAPPERIDALKFNEVDPKYWPRDLPPLNAQTVQKCAAVLLSFAKRWPNKGELE